MTQLPQSLGPYLLLEPLGRGGMGVVYKARHQSSGREVALKTVRVLESGQIQSIRREIHALASLQHPGIVRILEEGVQSGLPWYAMELVVGETLRQHVRRLRGGPGNSGPEVTQTEITPSTQVTEIPGAGTVFVPAPAMVEVSEAGARRVASLRPAMEPHILAAVLRIFKRLCRTLAFLHGEGIIHRDLKPSNILLRHDADPRALMPVLVDFGLVSQLQGNSNREELIVAGSASGTVAYMAPEQAQGELVDARADLYALGCILYELLTGRPPFSAATPARVLGMHLAVDPLPPSALVEGLSPELDGLVLNLLAKSPAHRLGHADDVAAALERLGIDDQLAGQLPRPRSYLYRSRFVGREEILSRLGGFLGRLAGGQGGMLLLGGESGVGKTRLLLELGRRAAGYGLQVLTGECLGAGADGAALPLQGLRRPLQAIADRCRERGLAEMQRLIGRGAYVLALYEPAFSALPGLEAYPEPAQMPPEAARLRLFICLVETLTALAEDQPVLLLLDDLHLADDLTLAALGFLLRASRQPNSRLLLVGTYRAEEIGSGRRAPLRILLESQQVESLMLNRLDEASIGALVSDMLALQVPAPAGFIRFLSRHSEGNPFFVAEFLRTAVDESLLFRDGTGRWQVAAESGELGKTLQYEDLPLPRSLRALVDRRLDGLSSEARTVVEAAAVLGREFSTELLDSVSGLEANGFLAGAAELVRRQVLESMEAGSLRFAHDKLRQFAYQRIAPERLRALHRTAALALASTSVKAAEDRAWPVLAGHWEAAAEAELAQEAYLAAARQARGRYAHSEAERFYLRYLQLLASRDLHSFAVRNELGRLVLEPLGRLREAAQQHSTALEEARQEGNLQGEAQSLEHLGWTNYRMGRFAEARLQLEEALTLYRRIGDRLGEAECLDGLASLCDSESRRDEAQALYRESLRIYRELGQREGTGRVLANLAGLHRNEGRFESAWTDYQQALEIAREVGNRRGEGICLGHLGALLCVRGLLPQSRLLTEQSLTIAREVGNRHGEGLGLENLGMLAFLEGKFQHAQSLFRQALNIDLELGDPMGEGRVRTSLGLLWIEQGDWPEARAQLLRGLQGLRLLGPGNEARTLGALSVLERREAGNWTLAQELLHQAMSLDFGLEGTLGAWFLCQQGHLELAQGRSAQEFLDQARQLLDLLEVGPLSEAGQAWGRLQGAQQAFEAGESRRLWRGELVEYVSLPIQET